MQPETTSVEQPKTNSFLRIREDIFSKRKRATAEAAALKFLPV
jgi:hypothetical protein